MNIYVKQCEAAIVIGAVGDVILYAWTAFTQLMNVNVLLYQINDSVRAAVLDYCRCFFFSFSAFGRSILFAF